MGIATFERHEVGCESQEEVNLRIDKMHRIVDDICNVKELKDVKEESKRKE